MTPKKLWLGGLISLLALAAVAVLIHSPAFHQVASQLHSAAGIHANGPAAQVVGAMTGDPAANDRAIAGVAEIGRRWDATAFSQTVALYEDVHRGIEWPGVLPARTVRYGEAPEQTFELYLPEQGFSEPGPVFLFLHGNGLGSFDREVAGSHGLLHSHLGKLSAVAGGIGVSMNYRGPAEFENNAPIAALTSLEPGAEDLRRVIDWIVANIDYYGGDPGTIVLAANSEGATVAAAYLLNEDWQTKSGHGIAAAILSSGLFGSLAPGIEALAASYAGEPVPLALWSGEFDLPAITNGIDSLQQRLCQKYSDCPHFARFPGHNHLSYLLSMGTADTAPMNAFIGFYHTVR